MIASRPELFSVLRQFNPWWSGGRSPDLPKWRRAAFREIREWMKNPPAGRALLITGARQIGKTTLFLQAIDSLLADSFPPSNILYVTFDHPLLKLMSLDEVIQLWREFEPKNPGPEFVFLDEIQVARDWQVWLKHQVDFEKGRRIAATGSAVPLVAEKQESGVGRWQNIRLATLSFYEYLQLTGLDPDSLPSMRSLIPCFQWSRNEFLRVSEAARPLSALFHEYLLRGGFPQAAIIQSIPLAQKLLREDIVDKVLKRDMTALFGVRRVMELEQTFVYLCLHDGIQLNLSDLCSSLELRKPTVSNFIDLLENAHLIYRLMPFGYGKQVLRGKPKIYLADAAIPSSVLLKGKAMLDDPVMLGRAVETAFFKHVFTRYYKRSIQFSYWRGKRDHEVDIIADVEGRVVPFEVKYRRQHTELADVPGLVEFCQEKHVGQAYLITQDITDFSVLSQGGAGLEILKIPAPLACYWLGKSEIEETGS